MGFFIGYKQNKRLEMMAADIEKELLTLSKDSLVSIISDHVNLDSYEKITNFKYLMEDMKSEAN